jgi:hypothetical protein
MGEHEFGVASRTHTGINPLDAIQFVRAIEEQWEAFCSSMRRHYLRRFAAPHRFFRALDRLTGCLQWWYTADKIRAEHLNLIRCESHREALITILSHSPSTASGKGDSRR